MPETKTKKPPSSPPKSTIPPAPDPLKAHASFGRRKANQAHSFLERSETEGGHARGMHSGLSSSDLDSRGKKVATSFLSDYDQDKSMAHLMVAGGGAGKFSQVASKPGGGYSAGTMTGDASGSHYRTAPLARVSEEQPDGSHKHFNAKVKKGFAKFTRQGGSTRAQTFFPSEYEPLPVPLPGGQVPTDQVKGDSIEDVKGKLRKTDTVEKYGGPDVGKVVEPSPASSEPEVSASPSRIIPPKPTLPEDYESRSKKGKYRARKRIRDWEAKYGS